MSVSTNQQGMEREHNSHSHTKTNQILDVFAIRHFLADIKQAVEKRINPSEKLSQLELNMYQ